jgi:hypothetical protein
MDKLVIDYISKRCDHFASKHQDEDCAALEDIAEIANVSDMAVFTALQERLRHEYSEIWARYGRAVVFIPIKANNQGYRALILPQKAVTSLQTTAVGKEYTFLAASQFARQVLDVGATLKTKTRLLQQASPTVNRSASCSC